MKPILINLGCGHRTHLDWINVDIFSHDPKVIQCDMRKGLPFKNNYADTIYHSHVLEHFSLDEGETFIRECFRVLKPEESSVYAYQILKILPATILQLLTK